MSFAARVVFAQRSLAANENLVYFDRYSTLQLHTITQAEKDFSLNYANEETASP